ncbi:MAG TPA: NAD-dependent epimerase/dehydratase family protein [Candidatus Paceibacterota bacterium]|nr:NAD-dependent epimerase/dehydratase family protein [Candidatus Paceibacterota bacterium]
MTTKVIVTGGEGFIGTHLCKALSDAGHEVVSVDLKSGNDIRDTELMKKMFAGATYVFHTAALPRVPYSIEHPQETNDHNIVGTLSVLVAAKDAGVKKVIYSASSSAYGDQDTMPLVETMNARPKSPYGLQKYVGELYCRVFNEVYGLPTVSLRYFNVYGPGASAEGAYALVIAKFLKQRSEGKPMTITGDGKQTRDFTHVRDVVRANMLAAQSEKVGKGEVINIGAGSNASVNKVAELIGGEVEHIEARLEPHDTLADNSKAKEMLGWMPEVRLEDGIAELKKIYNV